MSEKQKVCEKCKGTGDIRGVGYIHVECDKCVRGFITIETSPSDVKELPPMKIDKRSKTYKNAIKKLKELGLSDKEAEEKFMKGMKECQTR